MFVDLSLAVGSVRFLFLCSDALAHVLWAPGPHLFDAGAVCGAGVGGCFLLFCFFK